MKDIVIIGAGGFGREVAWLIEEINKHSLEWRLLGFIDDNLSMQNKMLNDVQVLGGLDWLKGKEDVYYICAIGNPKVKRKVVEKCMEYNTIPTTLIHPSVRISKYNTIGSGCIICSGNIITVNTVIGNHVIINLDSTIGHDAGIGDYCTILPSVNISGNVIIEEETEIGTGTAIIQGIRIGKGVVIGAGAVVVRDLPDNCTAVGVPAKIIKSSN
jgi:sugar O-acyltransferase (sialic acid O-acetyltransferase NeuD family)